MRTGIPVSPGITVARAYCIEQIFVDPRTRRLAQADVHHELERFHVATEQTSVDLRALYQKVASQVGKPEADVFAVQETILHDPAFNAKVRDRIVNEKVTAQVALHDAFEEYTSLFTNVKDDYLKERLADVRDVIVRLSGHLSDAVSDDTHVLEGPVVLVSDELLPSQVVMLGNVKVAGIVTQSGGQTSHAAILARSKGIPAVSGLKGILSEVKNGDLLVVDGREGRVLINPDAETESAYRKLEREFFDLKDHLAENRDHPAVTADGEAIELLANINNVADCKAAVAMGAAGVGLYRTEYLFLTHPDVPSEDEQLAAYQEIIQACPQKRVTIRTLDLGGDKTIPYLGHNREANPFMGWRSIRLSFEHPKFFLAQIRAVLRAAAIVSDEASAKVQLMFPMITTLEEIRRVRQMVKKAKRQLEREGKVQGEVSIGLMLEVPAAAISIDQLLRVVDFVSIGSNDLVQYLMAADRDNPKVSHLCQPLSPPVLRVLKRVIQACNKRGKKVTLCGEMAGAPRGFVLLYGMGLRSFSMSPAFIPTIKELCSHLTREQATIIVRHALRLKTTNEVRSYMQEQLKQICASMTFFDSL